MVVVLVVLVLAVVEEEVEAQVAVGLAARMWHRNCPRGASTSIRP
jgi:hypothetical protein